MERLSRERIVEAFEVLASQLPAAEEPIELVIVGGAVDIADAALLLSKMVGRRDEVWSDVSRHLVPGRELEARYAFEDLWEAAHGTD